MYNMPGSYDPQPVCRAAKKPLLPILGTEVARANNNQIRIFGGSSVGDYLLLGYLPNFTIFNYTKLQQILNLPENIQLTCSLFSIPNFDKEDY